MRNRFRQKFDRLLKTGAIAPLLLILFGCGPNDHGSANDDRPVVVTSFTVIEDFTRQVAGDHINVRVLAPAGAEVHEWELSPRNFIDLERADLVFTNGFGLEQWIPQLRATLSDGVDIVPVAEKSGYETIPIRTGDLEGNPDPHLWMDPRAVAAYVEVIRDRLIELDPAHEASYRENAENYLEKLDTLHSELERHYSAIAEDKRLLVTSEAAFLYFAKRYGFRHEGIWGSNAEEEGTPRQIARIIDLIREREPAALFWESTITDRYVQSVSEETGVPIAGPLYVDSLGGPGSGAESYLDLMRSNAKLIVEALTGGDA